MLTILALPTGTIGAAATVLLDLLSDLVDLRLGPSSRLASTFIAPLRPDDIYELRSAGQRTLLATWPCTHWVKLDPASDGTLACGDPIEITTLQ